VRDRAMLLLSAATAFRGDSARRLLWSDMFVASVPMDDLGLGTVVPVSFFYAVARPFSVRYSRPLGCSLMVPSTTSKVESTSMAHSVTVWWITVRSEGQHFSSSHISMYSGHRYPNSHLTLKISHVVNTDVVNGMITTCSGHNP